MLCGRVVLRGRCILVSRLRLIVCVLTCGPPGLVSSRAGVLFLVRLGGPSASWVLLVRLSSSRAGSGSFLLIVWSKLAGYQFECCML